jgi:hypothetical protein
MQPEPCRIVYQRLFAVCKQLRKREEIRIDAPGTREEKLRDGERGGVRVVQTQAVEGAGTALREE